jgi:hypothetical protein
MNFVILFTIIILFIPYAYGLAFILSVLANCNVAVVAIWLLSTEFNSSLFTGWVHVL